jgi:thioredoxin-like negative regulator of GroEL
MSGFFRAKQFIGARCQASRYAARSLCCVLGVAAICSAQESGRQADAMFNKGAEIAVMVHDESREPISSTVMVAIYKDGTMPVAQAGTSRGVATFVVTSLGEFSVMVEAAGYRRVVKEISVPQPQRTLVDVFLQKEGTTATTVGVPGRPVLAPKAKEAFEKGLQALSADKMSNAEKYVNEAARLAPGHPDVLYVQGILYLKERKWEKAQSVLESATQIDPSHARAFAALGMALSDEGKYRAAIAPLESSVKIDPAIGWDAEWALAKAYYHEGRYGDGLKMSQMALDGSKGKAPEIALLVAQSLTAVGKYSDAEATLRGFVKEHGDRPEATTARRWLQKLEENRKIEVPKQEAMKQ